MAQIRAARLARGTQLLLGPSVLYTVPAGHRAMLRWRSLVNNDTGPQTVILAITGIIVNRTVMTAVSENLLECRWVLEAGDQLQLSLLNPPLNGVAYHFDGYDLTL